MNESNRDMAIPSAMEADGSPQKNPRNWLREFLAGRHVDCDGCGYDLYDLQSDHCPECGKPLRLRVAVVSPLSKPWLIGLVCLSASLGLSLAVLIMIIWFGRVWNNPDSGGVRVFGWFVVASAGYVALIYAWCRQRVVIHLLARDVQYAFATACIFGFPLGAVLHCAMVMILS